MNPVSEKEQTLEEKTKEYEAIMKTASDPTFALQVMSVMNMRKPQDCALAALGIFRYYYYCFCHEYHYPPKDLIDLVDGVLYNEVVHYAEDYFMKQQKIKSNGKP